MPTVCYASTLEKKVRKYVKKFGIKYAFAAKEFAYLPKINAVTFSVLRYDTDWQLINHIKDVYEVDITPWFFIFSLLHEIGHHKTLREFSDEEYAEDQMWREVFNAIATPEVNYAYFHLPIEKKATEWAINYIENHEQECWDFQKRCIKDIIHICKKKSFHY